MDIKIVFNSSLVPCKADANFTTQKKDTFKYQTVDGRVGSTIILTMSVIDIQTMRYINLLDSASRVKTRKCFVYNNTIIFAVPRALMSRAIGPNAAHVRFIQEKLGKKIRIIEEAAGLEDAQRFVRDIVAPVGFKTFELKEGFFVLTAGMQSKAALLGRNKRRYDELRQILRDTFGYDLKIL